MKILITENQSNNIVEKILEDNGIECVTSYGGKSV